MIEKSETWKPVSGIPGMEVSPSGIVRTLDRVVPHGKYTQFVKGRILKPQDNGIGYLQVGFYKDGKRVNRYVHRLVAQAFIPNPDNLPEINHKDCNRSNNDVSNLEWVTHVENNQYRNKYGTSYKESAKKNPVYAVNLDTLEVSHFSSQSEASRILVIAGGNISRVLKGQYKQANGYWFVSADENITDAIKQRDDIPLEWNKVVLEEAE